MTEPLPHRTAFFQAGGALLLETPSYVRREADEDLFERLLAGEYCYLLTARQAGKSSLMVRTADRLRRDGAAVAMIDLTAIGTVATDADQWYFGVVSEIGRHLGVQADLGGWWDGQARLPVAQRLVGFLRDLVLAQIDDHVVIFIDEIDCTIGLKFSKDFLTAIRSCFNARATEPVFKRLTFVLLGVASPTDLIADPTHTPFNIGSAIDVTDFTWDEARTLLPGLSDDPAKAERTLRRILDWTGGQPYLTQKLCVLCTPATGEPGQVDTVVARKFLQPGLHKSEHNLTAVHSRVTAAGKPTSRILRLYRRVLRGRHVSDRSLSPAHNELKLCGLVKAAPGGRLQVRNRLYETVFDRRWIRREMPADWGKYAVRLCVLLLVAYVVYYEVIVPVQLLAMLTGPARRPEVPLNPVEFQIARDTCDQLRSVWPYLYSNKADELWGDMCRGRFRAIIQRDEEVGLWREADALARATFSELRDLEDRHPDVSKTAHADFARFYERRAMRAEFAEPHAFAILWRLKALTSDASDENRRAVNQLVEPDDRGPHATLGRSASVRAATFSPDGKTVLTGSLDNTARLWNAATGAPLGEPLRHDGSVLAVTFSADSKRVLTGSDDKTARLWDAASGEPLGEPLRHDGSVLAVTFSPDGKTALTGSDDKTARLWDGASGEPLGEPLRHDGSVLAVTFSPDGKMLLTRCLDKTARLWDAATGVALGKPLRHVVSAKAEATARPLPQPPPGPTGRQIASVNAEAVTTDGALLSEDIAAFVNAATFSPDAKIVLTASDDGTARLWNAVSGESLGEPLRHDRGVWAAVFSPDGKTVVTGSMDKTARVWNVATGALLGEPLRHDHGVTAVAFSPDGKIVLSGSMDNTARLWKAATGLPVGEPLRHTAWVRTAMFSPDGTEVLTVSWDNAARLWSAWTGSPLAEPVRHDGGLTVVAFSPDGKTVLTGRAESTVELRKAATGEPVGEPLRHDDSVTAVTFSPDGKLVLTASQDKTARLWKAATGEPVGEPLRHDDSVRAVTFSSDGKLVLTGSDDKTARLWNVVTGEPVGGPFWHDGPIAVVTFSLDGKTVLTGGDDNTARLWIAATSVPLGQPLRHDGDVLAATFSPDGKTVVTASDDTTLRLWEAASGRPFGRPLRHDGPVCAVTFSPDGKWMLSATKSRLHRWTWGTEGFRQTSSRFFRGGVGGLDGRRPFLNPDGSRLRIAYLVSDDSLAFRTVDFEHFTASPLEGDPEELLEEWQRKLALTIDDRGDIVPLWP